MITPSRWFSGGRGLDAYRSEMLHDRRIRKLVDYEDAGECFPGVDMSGGVSYFLWERDYDGDCTVVNMSHGKSNERHRGQDVNTGNEMDEGDLPIVTQFYLYLSGTPFRALNSGEFIEEQIYNWTYSASSRPRRPGPPSTPASQTPTRRCPAW